MKAKNKILRTLVRFKNMTPAQMALLLGIGLAKKAIVLFSLGYFTCL